MFGTEVANAGANHATCETTASHANACAAFRTRAFVGCEESMLSFAGGYIGMLPLQASPESTAPLASSLYGSLPGVPWAQRAWHAKLLA